MTKRAAFCLQMSSRLVICLAFCLLVCGITHPIAAQNEDTASVETRINPRIVINDTIGPAGSKAFAAGSEFDAVVSMNAGGSFCTGVLIAADTVLTARHCGILTSDTVVFGTDLNSPDFSIGISAVSNPAGGGSLLDGGDLTIVTLSGDVPTSVASPMKLTNMTSGLVGMEAAMIGFGFNGVGSTGHQNSADDMRWGAMNLIDQYGSPASASGSNIISTDFDDGSAGNNTIAGSSLTPLTLEGTTAPGDSGGPVLVQVNSEWVVAGTLSGGSTSNSVYGDISWWTGVAPFQSEIEAAGGVFIVIPEPGSAVVLILGGYICIRRRRNFC